MVKLLVLIFLALLLWIVLERLLAALGVGAGGRGRFPGHRGPPEDPRSAPAARDVVLVACDGCGVHVPRSRLRATGGRSLCNRCRAES